MDGVISGLTYYIKKTRCFCDFMPSSDGSQFKQLWLVF